VTGSEQQADPATAYKLHESCPNGHDQGDLLSAPGTIPDHTIGLPVSGRGDGPYWKGANHRLIELRGEHLQLDGSFEHLERGTRQRPPQVACSAQQLSVALSEVLGPVQITHEESHGL
jgi:hypothetical protein